MADERLCAAIWEGVVEHQLGGKVEGRWKFYRLSDGQLAEMEGDFVIHLASGQLWSDNWPMLQKLGAHLVAMPRSYIQDKKGQIF